MRNVFYLKFILLSLIVTLAACDSNYGYIGNQDGAESGFNIIDPEVPNNPPNNNDDTPQNPPHQPSSCDLKIIVKVKELEMKDGSGQFNSVKVTPHEVDLCALSKDFMGVLRNTVKPLWQSQEQFTRLNLILDEPSLENRVENSKGEKICDLRVPPGAEAGLHFLSTKNAISVLTDKILTFVLNQERALIIMKDGVCQLRYPVGNHDIK
jgi:hypothetical protein